MPTVRINVPIDATEIDEPDATEITELQVAKVSAVAAPANGTSFLLLKSVQKETPVKKHTKEKAKAAALTAMKGTKPAGTVGTSDPELGEDESAEMQRIVTKAAASDNPQIQNALKVLNDVKASPEAKRVAYSLLKQGNGGDVAPQLPAAHDANDVNAVLQPGDLAKLRRERDAETDPVKKERLGQELTYQLLRAANHNPNLQPVRKAAVVDTSTDTPEIAALRKQYDNPALEPALKMQVGNILSQHDLAKSAYEESQEATNRLVAETQARVTENAQSASGGTSGGAAIPVSDDPRFQIRALGPAARLADEGKLTLEPSPHVTGQHEDPLVKEQRGLDETLANLRALHGG